MRNKFWLVALAALLCLSLGCSTATIALKSGYDFSKVKKIAVLRFNGVPENPNSGDMVADIFAKNLLNAGYTVIERNDLDKIIAERKLDLSGNISNAQIMEIGKVTGVDAVITGTIPVYTPERKEVVVVNIKNFNTNRTYDVRAVPRKDDPTKYETQTQAIDTRTFTEEEMPVTHTIEAEVGVTAKMLDVATGEVIWIASDTYQGTNIQTAAEYLISGMVKELEKQIKKSERK